MPVTHTYQLPGSNTSLEVLLEDGSIWLTQAQICQLFGKSKSTVSGHFKNIFEEKELVFDSVVRKFRTTAADGKQYETQYYNFDLILSLGYRVKSPQTAPFRAWATDRIAEEKEFQIPVIQENSDIVFYSDPDGKLHIELTYDGDTFWTTQRKMGELFSVDTRTISYHLQQIFDTKELNKYSVIRKIWITAADGIGRKNRRNNIVFMFDSFYHVPK